MLKKCEQCHISLFCLSFKALKYSPFKITGLYWKSFPCSSEFGVEYNKLYKKSIKLWEFPLRKKELKNKAERQVLYYLQRGHWISSLVLHVHCREKEMKLTWNAVFLELEIGKELIESGNIWTGRIGSCRICFIGCF